MSRETRTPKLISQLLEFWYATTWLALTQGSDRELVHNLVGTVANIQEGDKVLEVGSNLPNWTSYSHRVGPTGSFYALDTSLAIQKSAQNIIRRQNGKLCEDAPRPTILTGDATSLPFSNSSLDMVIANNYTIDSWSMYAEAKRVLKPGGKIITSSTNERSTRINIDILKSLNLSPKFANLELDLIGELWIYTATNTG